MHFDAVRAPYAAALDPLIAFYHRPRFGCESPASDLIESLRPLVEALVWELFRTETLWDDHFSRENGRVCSERPAADASSAVGSRSRAHTAAGCGCIVVSSPGTCAVRGQVGWRPMRKTCRWNPDAA